MIFLLESTVVFVEESTSEQSRFLEHLIKKIQQSNMKKVNKTVIVKCKQFYLRKETRFHFNYWDPRNINKNGEFIGITLLLLEEKVPSSSL
ncbi:unnamed protein product [Brassica oleracea var. botrytis]